MGIPDEDVAQVRASTDIVALIGEHAALRRQGRRWVGLCPFHAEKTPSFSVNAEEGFYYCFGCQASGDAITFVRSTEHLDFVEAVRYLADRSGIAIREDTSGGAAQHQRSVLLEAMERAVTWYHERLLSAPDAGSARNYLRSRGYGGELVRKFRLGWAPDEWDALSRALGLSERALVDTGLGFRNRRGNAQDAFRARIIFPICDPSGRPIALGGRILPVRGESAQPGSDERANGARRPEPKYKNSPETPIYSKRRTLYALNWAKMEVVQSGEVVVCEGYTDVIGFFSAGVARAVATCGTALAEEHFKLLRNFGRRIVLAYDADSAGQSAVSRVYEWEHRHEVEVVVAQFPPGSDPGDLARTDPEALRNAVAEARPLLQFRIDRVFASADLATVEGRARAAEAALRAVAEHPDALVRDQYVMQIADRCRLEPQRARQRLEECQMRGTSGAEERGAIRGGDRRRDRHREVGPDGMAHTPTGSTEGSSGVEGDDHSTRRAPRRLTPSSRPGLEGLRLAVHRPVAVVGRLHEVLFTDDVQRRAYAALTQTDSVHEAVERSTLDVADLLRRVTVEEPVDAGDPLVDPVDAVVFQLIRGAVWRELSGMSASVRTEAGDLESVGSQTAVARRLLEDLDDPGACHLAAERLLAWLVEREGR
ncbi:MAG: DNA primase [Acidimicrobiales bacterium]